MKSKRPRKFSGEQKGNASLTYIPEFGMNLVHSCGWRGKYWDLNHNPQRKGVYNLCPLCKKPVY